MLCLGKVLPHQRPLFSCGDYDIFTSFQSSKESRSLQWNKPNPARLLTQVLQERVVYLRENPDRFLCMAARENEDRQHILFLR